MASQSTTEPLSQSSRIVLTGGGTGGHVSPIVAVVEELRHRGHRKLLWIGSRGSLEQETAARLEVPFRAISVGKLRRYASIETPIDTLRVPLGIIQARNILKRFRPNVVFSTGGYVGVPAVVAGRMLGIPSLTHEQTAHVGLATRINARFSDVIALSFERSLPRGNDLHARVVVTGNPVRSVALNGTPGAAYQTFNLADDLPLVYVTGGAQGARAINAAVVQALPRLLRYVTILHQYGPRSIQPDYDQVPTWLEQVPAGLRRRYRAVERVGDEIGDIYATASLVVGRSGAGTVGELAAVGLPSILIPLPGAYEQQQNALVLAEAGASIVLPQDDLTPDRLVELVTSIVSDEYRMRRMREALRQAAPDQPAKHLVDEILTLTASCA